MAKQKKEAPQKPSVIKKKNDLAPWEHDTTQIYDDGVMLDHKEKIDEKLVPPTPPTHIV